MEPDALATGKAKLTVLKVALWLVEFAALAGAAYIALPATIVGTALQQIGVLVWAATLPPTYESFVGQVGKLAPAPG